MLQMACISKEILCDFIIPLTFVVEGGSNTKAATPLVDAPPPAGLSPLLTLGLSSLRPHQEATAVVRVATDEQWPVLFHGVDQLVFYAP